MVIQTKGRTYMLKDSCLNGVIKKWLERKNGNQRCGVARRESSGLVMEDKPMDTKDELMKNAVEHMDLAVPSVSSFFHQGNTEANSILTLGTCGFSLITSFSCHLARSSKIHHG